MNILSHQDENRLQTNISPRSPFGFRDRAMIDFVLSTGLRVGELVGLRVKHVCGANPQGTGRRVRNRLALPAALAKGGRARLIPLNEQARQAVLDILIFNYQRGFSVAAEAPLFPNRKHQAMSTRAVRRVLSAHCIQAELDQAVSPHDLRHTFATRLIDSDVPTHSVQVLLGHVRRSSTEVYLHSSPARLAEAVSRISR